MRDRLIALILNTPVLKFPSGSRAQGKTYQTAQNLADHLLANGVIVPPCNVGDTVYRITECYGGGKIIIEGEAFEFAITHEHIKDKYRLYFWAKGEELIRRQFSLWCDFTDFGKTVFLTKEEAEKALERSGE